MDKPKRKNTQSQWVFDFRLIHILILIVLIICMLDPFGDTLFRQIYTQHGILFGIGVLALYGVLAIIYEYIYQALANQFSNLSIVTLLLSLCIAMIVVSAMTLSSLHPTITPSSQEIMPCTPAVSLNP